MICPYCAKDDDKVIDSRSSEGGKVIRRRRECAACHKRFTTYERLEQTARLMVVKRDGAREVFNRENILRGVQAACGKRPISEERLQALVDAVEDELHREHDREVESSTIGERIMAKLRDLDEVAYIRFASEYHQFRTIDELMTELRDMMTRPRDMRDQQGLFEGEG